MKINLSVAQVIAHGISHESAQHFIEQINSIIHSCSTLEQSWQAISPFLSKTQYPFAIHLYLFTELFPQWHEHPETAPAWTPGDAHLRQANIAGLMEEVNCNDIAAFHQWTTQYYQDFWKHMIQKLNIVFKNQANTLCDLSNGLESPKWLPGAQLNIVDSCFTAIDSSVAIIQGNQQTISTISYGELKQLSNRVANSLIALNYTAGDAIGIIMPMNIHAVAIYLGIIKMGGIVVSIADSFSNQEIAIRLKIAETKAVFTQDFLLWGGKKLSLYEKVCHSYEGRTIVLPYQSSLELAIQAYDLNWANFLVEDTQFHSVPCDPMATDRKS